MDRPTACSVLTRTVDVNQSSLSLSKQCVCFLISTLTGIIKTGSADQKFIEDSLDFLRSFISHFSLADIFLDLLCESAVFSYTSQLTTLFQTDIPIEFVHFLKAFTTTQASKLDPSLLNPIRTKMLKFLRLYHKISAENPEERETFEDIADTLLKAVIQSISVEIESSGLDQILDRVCQAAEAVNHNQGDGLEDERVAGRLSLPLGRQAETLLSIVRDLKQLETQLTQIVVREANTVKSVESVSFLCLAACFSPDNRSSIMNALKPRIEELLQNNQGLGSRSRKEPDLGEEGGNASKEDEEEGGNASMADEEEGGNASMADEEEGGNASIENEKEEQREFCRAAHTILIKLSF